MCADARGEHDWLADAVRAIADGTPVPWPQAPESNEEGGDDAELLRCLRVISEIAAAGRDSSSKAGTNNRDSPPEPLLDGKWGPLTLGPLIGRGSFGDVYRAWDTRLGREVALKLLRGSRSDRSRDSDSHVLEEGRLLAKVHHPNVAVVYGADEIDGRVGVWMELVEGRTLEEELTTRGRFEPSETAAIGVEVCAALAAVHAAGLIHRDVKAHNVLREQGGRIVLTDFGTGCEQDAGNEAREVSGTLPYLAPELFEGVRPSPRTDIYSIGVLLFHLLTDRYPVGGATPSAVRDAHRNRTRLSLDDARPGLPRGLVDIIDRAVSPDPERRFASASEMRAALERHRASPPARTRRRFFATAAIPALVLALLGGAWLVRAVASRGTPAATTARRDIHAAAVTTRSPAALRLYEDAVALLEPDRSEQSQAEALLRQAIALDPSFATAHIMLAFALNNQDKPREMSLAVANRSRELERNVTEAERLFIEGSAELLAAHMEPAIASYEALVRVDPTHYWAVNNLAYCYRQAGRQDDALPYFARAADLRPGVVEPQVRAAERLCEAGRFAEGQVYARRAATLIAAGKPCERGWRRWIEFYPVFERWRQGDISGTEAALARVVASHRGELWEAGNGGENIMAEFAGDWYMTLGQLRKARAMYATATINPDVRGAYQAYWASAAANPPLFRRGIHEWYAAVGPAGMNWWTAGMLAQAGLVRGARSALNAMQTRATNSGTPEVPLVQALQRYVHGEIGAATGDLRTAFDDFNFALRRMPHGWQHAPLAGISGVLERRHAPEAAITLLEQTLPRRAIYTDAKVWGADWLKLEAQRADLYRQVGREAHARSVEAELRALLVHADLDHPILRQLRDR